MAGHVAQARASCIISGKLDTLVTGHSSYHIRRIYTEEKAKVVAAVWRTELLQFLAAR